ncbi:MAG TPA: C45 family autoproteolytic acyltransferase/hydrolase [Dictyoglomaceae bacterium]|nr:C45 family autoproteolytic acyltransferase/hydrolase [Dictyoglomaceae bacterium]HOL39899.1 C45 family autoproteolytic acyltransferase/hydrolase [Dictyoglomaceae bacterium]HOP95293.1 C45 family autoproteolytic acyltransferase/hydrolase [Dictyoglomaceae bacterium]HPP16272.1 C45 family autoproteolytic acyltransferase/hydrolase [Dictyoglomaceae bacterium]HPP16277.1 C45 family autoproteolytic acyltransferase/hydrolase [Dictyoglomaceae bacterium]
MKRVFCFLLIFLLIFTGCTKPQEEISKQAKIRVVELHGTPYERGYQHGKILKEEIRYITNRVEDSVCLLEGDVKGKIVFRFMLEMAKDLEGKFSKKFPEFKELKEEMRGISDGAGVSYDIILLINLIDEIAATYYWYLDPILKTFACSSFVARSSQGLIVGRNLDYGILLSDLPYFLTVFIYHPEKGYPFISISWPGLVGTYSGISQDLYIFLNVSSSNKNTEGAPECLVTRRIIQYSKNLDEAAASVLHPLQGLNLLVGTKDDAMVIEISPNKKAIRKLDKFVIATNHFASLEMQEEQAPGEFDERPVPLPDGTSVVQENTKVRAEKIRKMLEEEDDVSMEYAKKILTEVSTRGLTLQSIVYIPQKGDLFVTVNPKVPICEGQFQLDELLNSQN